MKDPFLELGDIKDRECELQSLVDVCGKPELVHCVRLLSMYVALYKKSFGELPRKSYEKILSSNIVDADTARIFENGMLEAISILDMVLQSHAGAEAGRVTKVTLN